MRKADVVDKVAQITANDKVEVEEIIDCLLHCIRLELIKGEQVTIATFGTFKVELNKARFSNITKQPIPEAFKPTIKFSKKCFINKFKHTKQNGKEEIHRRLKLHLRGEQKTP